MCFRIRPLHFIYRYAVVPAQSNLVFLLIPSNRAVFAVLQGLLLVFGKKQIWNGLLYLSTTCLWLPSRHDAFFCISSRNTGKWCTKKRDIGSALSDSPATQRKWLHGLAWAAEKARKVTQWRVDLYSGLNNKYNVVFWVFSERVSIFQSRQLSILGCLYPCSFPGHWTQFSHKRHQHWHEATTSDELETFCTQQAVQLFHRQWPRRGSGLGCWCGENQKSSFLSFYITTFLSLKTVISGSKKFGQEVLAASAPIFDRPYWIPLCLFFSWFLWIVHCFQEMEIFFFVERDNILDLCGILKQANLAKERGLRCKGVFPQLLHADKRNEFRFCLLGSFSSAENMRFALKPMILVKVTTKIQNVFILMWKIYQELYNFLNQGQRFASLCNFTKAPFLKRVNTSWKFTLRKFEHSFQPFWKSALAS